MKLLSTWRDYLNTGRVRLDVGQGVILDTENITPKDTGWRQVTPPTGVTGNIFIRRYGRDVHIMFHQLATTTAGNITVYALPMGFRPQTISGANWRNGTIQDDAGTSMRQASYFNGNMRVLSMEASKQYGGYFTYITSDAWPTALPGTAV